VGESSPERQPSDPEREKKGKKKETRAYAESHSPDRTVETGL